MGNDLNHENRSLEWWRNLASRLAFLFAATILISSGIGLWFSGEMRDLQHNYKKLTAEVVEIVKANETLVQENAEIDQVAKSRLDTIEELKSRNYDLTVDNGTLLKKLESENRVE